MTTPVPDGLKRDHLSDGLKRDHLSDELKRDHAERPRLDRDQVTRYSRHLIIPEVGVDGQRRLLDARVLVVGAGGLGSPALLYLAAAGVGTIGVIDDDVVEISNLQRQVLHGVGDLGRPKVESAAEAVARLDPAVTVEQHQERLTRENATEIVGRYDLVLDGADNFATRYLVNDACVLTGTPLVWGSIFRFDGQVTVWNPPHGPCYRCVFPEPPPAGTVPSCAEGGVLGVLPAAIGSAQVAEALKLILGIGEPLIGRLLLHDALRATWSELAVERDPACVVCGDAPTVVTPGIDADQCDALPLHVVEAAQGHTLDAATLRRRLTDRESGREDFELIDVREPNEVEINRIDGSVNIPKGLFESGEALTRLDPSRPVVLYCKGGVRSAQVLAIVRAAGFDADHLGGGITAWIDQIEPEQLRY